MSDVRLSTEPGGSAEDDEEPKMDPHKKNKGQGQTYRKQQDQRSRMTINGTTSEERPWNDRPKTKQNAERPIKEDEKTVKRPTEEEGLYNDRGRRRTVERRRKKNRTRNDRGRRKTMERPAQRKKKDRGMTEEEELVS